MKAIASCGLVALAIVATVALFPGSSWIFRNQMDLLVRQGPARDVDDFAEIGAPTDPPGLEHGLGEGAELIERIGAQSFQQFAA